MDPYRSVALEGRAVTPRASLVDSCAFLRAPGSIDDFVEALVSGTSELVIVRELSKVDLDTLASSHEHRPTGREVISVLGLTQVVGEAGEDWGVLCIDPGKNWWSETTTLEWLSSVRGALLTGLIDVACDAFGVRWCEDGATTRRVLRIGQELELAGKTQIEEVGVDMSKLDALGTRAVGRVPSGEVLSSLSFRVVFVRDPLAEARISWR